MGFSQLWFGNAELIRLKVCGVSGWRSLIKWAPGWKESFFIVFQSEKRCPRGLHLPSSYQITTHLTLTSSPRIHYLIRLTSPCILPLTSFLLDLSELLFAPADNPSHHAKRAQTQRHTNTPSQTLLDVSIISLGIDCSAVSKEQERERRGKKERDRTGEQKGKCSCEGYAAAAASVWDYRA